MTAALLKWQRGATRERTIHDLVAHLDFDTLVRMSLDQSIDVVRAATGSAIPPAWQRACARVQASAGPVRPSPNPT